LPRLIGALKVAQAAMQPRASASSKDVLSSALYEVSWREAPALSAETTTSGIRRGRWVLFVDHGGFGHSLGAAIAEGGGTVAEVRVGASYSEDGDHAFRIAPEEAQDYGRLWRELERRGPLAGIVYCWALDADLAEMETARVLAAGAPIAVMRQLLARGDSRLWLVGSGAVDVGDDAPLAPAQAPLWGLAKALALECPRRWGGFVDIGPGVDAKALLPVLSGGSEEDQVALRVQRRLVPRLARMNAPQAHRMPIDQEGAYLITGGLGGLGLVCADWLVTQGARHLWLLGRRPPGEEVCSVIAALRRRGAQVRTVAADIADAAAITGVMKAIAAGGAPLKGVLHAAGEQSSCLVGDMTPDEIRRIYRAKMEGVWVLHQATTHSNLDFFVLFSSISATWGSKAQSHYAGANAFLDLLARARRRAGLPATSIAWGPWAGVGMMREDTSAVMQRIGIAALGSEDNIQALSQLVAAAVCQATVADVDWSCFLPVVETAGRRPFFDLMLSKDVPAEAAPPVQHPLANLAQLPAEERLRCCLAEVRVLTGTILGLDAAAAEIDQGFFDMGFDSLMGLELKNRLEAAIRAPLPATLVFDYPTIRNVAEFIATGKPNGSGEDVGAHRPASPSAAIDEHEDGDQDLDVAVTRRLEKLEALMRQER
jgi:NAD(P)-dependent dehydrogenase (short-subunit alcohol dehydrogenase family)